ncbi:MAG: Maf family protein [Peptococcaceae bacterium]|nr:Maf family protein [Peptococcaceae bacterium]
MPPIYLASASPRRRELLEQLGLPFTVVVRSVDENIAGPLPPGRMVEVLAEKKARKVAVELDRGLVIGSDTVVVWRDRVLGKPGSRKEALEMLACLQGDDHSVYSGLAVIDVETGAVHVSHERTRVFFRPAAKDELEMYVDTGEPMDKAGGYAVQGLGAVFVSRIEGCYSNVVGLPLARLARVLKEFGVDVLSINSGACK